MHKPVHTKNAQEHSFLFTQFGQCIDNVLSVHLPHTPCRQERIINNKKRLISIMFYINKMVFVDIRSAYLYIKTHKKLLQFPSHSLPYFFLCRPSDVINMNIDSYTMGIQ